MTHDMRTKVIDAIGCLRIYKNRDEEYIIDDKSISDVADNIVAALSPRGDEDCFRRFAPDVGKVPIRRDAPDHLTIKTSAELAIAGGDEVKKSEGGVEGHAATSEVVAGKARPAGQGSSRGFESPDVGGGNNAAARQAGIKSGPSDPSADRREIVARIDARARAYEGFAGAVYFGSIVAKELRAILAALDGGADA